MPPGTYPSGAAEKELPHDFGTDSGGQKAAVNLAALHYASRDPGGSLVVGAILTGPGIGADLPAAVAAGDHDRNSPQHGPAYVPGTTTG